ncbi:hypothetical protein HZA57_04040, partial [Candidatus Poribacteria bacterium]|nr:hypothetical protein [Candidatus Poribacteria bacterium]
MQTKNVLNHAARAALFAAVRSANGVAVPNYSCPCKVNLHLDVLRRRADGFHELETVFQELDWADELHVE